MKKNIYRSLLAAAIFAALLYNPFSQGVSAQDGMQYENQGGTPLVLPEHLLQRMEMKNNLETGEIVPVPQTERPVEPQWTIPYYSDQKYIHEWTAGVFSAWNYSTGNYDLLMRQPILSDPVMITGSAGNELYPRLSRDSSAVIYSSDETGDMDIYWMKIGGSGKTNLTNTPGDDYAANWSLNNQWIAYVHEISGLPQVFIMRPDGSQNQQVTQCTYGCYDPALSPDASQIAYIERLLYAPGAQIIISNRDGSGRRILFTDPYQVYFPGDLAWSPNGKWLAFDYYTAYNYYSQMGWVPTDGTSGLVLAQYLPPYYGMDPYLTDYWINGWGPDSGYLTITVVHYVKDSEGNYVFDGSDAVIYSTSNGGPAELQLFYILDGGQTFFADFQSADRTPPQSALTPLPDFTRGTVTLAWNSSGTGLARPTDVQLQRRNGVDGTWSDIAKPSNVVNPWPLPQGQFVVPAGEPGTLTFFRTRVKDAAQQWEAWTESPNQIVSTANYRWNLVGHVFDNRNNPIKKQPVTLSVPPLLNELTDQSGFFHALFTNSSQITMEVNRDGYGTLPATALQMNSDKAHDFYLPPILDQIQNGGFEDDTNGWTLAGTLPVQMSNNHFQSGQKSLELGAACAFPCLLPNGEEINPYLLVEDHHGTLYLLTGTSTTEIQYRERNGAWSSPLSIPYPVGQLHTVVSPTGRFYALYFGLGTINGYYRDPGGEWTTQPTIETIAYTSYWSFGVNADETNRLYFAIVGRIGSVYPLDFYEYDPQNGSLTQSNVSNDVGTSSRDYEIMSIPGGGLIIYSSNTQFARGHDGFWKKLSDQYPVDSMSMGTFFNQNASGRPIKFRATAANSKPVIYTVQTLDDRWNWSERVTVDQPPTYISYPDAARCPDGSLYLITRGSGNSKPLLRMDRSGNLEATSIDLAAFPDVYMLFCDSDGLPAAYDYTSLYEIAADAIQGTAEASQSVSIPADMEKATLSFALRLDFVRQSQQTALEVIVRDAAEVETNLLSIKKSGDWRQEWADLSPWAGQTVTIIFRLNQAAGEPKAKAWIDGVSVGSWETPTLESVEPYRFVFPEEAPNLIVRGQNFHEGATVQINGMDVSPENVTWQDEFTLIVNTPEFIRPGFNSVRVANPGGAYDELLFAFRTGLELFLPMVSR